ncbi:MAG: chemotaxis protein CheB, partial [Nocardioidaceae bacterium]
MAPISVLVVDDSVVVRRLLSNLLAEVPDVEVAGVAANGRIALAKIPHLNPDLVLLDIEMPVLGGLETLWRMCCDHPDIPVIMFSAITERSAAVTLDALELGAQDYVTKPDDAPSMRAAMESVRDQLVPKMRSLCRSKSIRLRRGDAPAARPKAPVGRTRVPAAGTNEILVIGASTGGPDALTTVLSALPANLPIPVLVVQHMPPMFTRLFAQRLDRISALDVSEAKHGDLVEPGRVLVAPGDFHLRLLRSRGPVTVALDQSTPVNFCRPSVDVMF